MSGAVAAKSALRGISENLDDLRVIDLALGTAATNDHHIIYDAGNLFYDSNGDAPGGKVLICMLQSAPTIDAGDILVI